jgi:outer membrane protein TolC
MKQVFFAALLCTAIVGVNAQNGVQTLTINEAVRLALEQHLNLRRNALDVQTRQRSADRAWNGVLPTVSAGLNSSHATSIVPDYTAREGLNVGLSLSASLTLSTSIIDNIKQARANYELGLINYEAARQELELQIRKLFYQILLLDSNRELAAQNFASAQARYEQSASLARVGQASRLDEMSARVDMENMRPAVRNAAMIYENALDSFKTILGFPAETTISLAATPPPPQEAMPPDSEQAPYQATPNQVSPWDLSPAALESIRSGNNAESLEAASLRKSIQSLEAQLRSVRNSAYIPNLRMSWNTGPSYNLHDRNWSDNGSFSVTLGINLDSFLSWSSAKTKMEKLNDNIDSAQIQLTDTLRNRENRINQNIRNIERIVESLEAMQLNVELAQSTYDMYVDSYRRGAVDFQQLRGAVDSLGQARNSLLLERYNLLAVLLDLEKELNVPFGTLTVVN